MLGDSEVRREVWKSRIVLELSFIPSEFSIIDTPRPFFVFVSQLTFLPLLMDRIKKYLRSTVNFDDSLDNVWFEFNGLPLKWYYPIGVLRDYFWHSKAPWALTVHIRNHPEDLCKCDDKFNVEFHFVQTVKEADQIKHKGSVVESMQCEDYKQLWNNFFYERYDQFWLSNKRLFENTDDNPMRYVPIRIYPPDRFKFVQKLIRPMKTAESENCAVQLNTIRDVLPRFLNLHHQTCLEDGKVSIVSHGIVLPLDTPLLWMAEHLCYPDNFVHLCIRINADR